MDMRWPLDDPWVLGLVSGFICLMMILVVIDVRTMVIPNRLVYPSLLIVAGYVGAARLAGGELDPGRALIGMLICGGGLLIIAFFFPVGMGMGGVKLGALIGLVLGALGLGYVGTAAAVWILLAVGFAITLVRRRRYQAGVPIAPGLVTGAILSLFLTARVIDLLV